MNIEPPQPKQSALYHVGLKKEITEGEPMKATTWTENPHIKRPCFDCLDYVRFLKIIAVPFIISVSLNVLIILLLIIKYYAQ